ncbi:hypothetical protein RJZ57_000913 [Blastomyces gilchristii]
MPSGNEAGSVGANGDFETLRPFLSFASTLLCDAQLLKFFQRFLPEHSYHSSRNSICQSRRSVPANMLSEDQLRRATNQSRKFALRVKRAMNALKIDVCQMKLKGIREGVIVSCLGCIRAVTFTAGFAVAYLTPPFNNKRFLTVVELEARGKDVSRFVLKTFWCPIKCITLPV